MLEWQGLFPRNFTCQHINKVALKLYYVTLLRVYPFFILKDFSNA